MARKNGMKNDSSSITFNTRTKAVMADIVQDNVKEKVTAVREVVSGKSNNEIILVLQYYDYDVERSIQAYLEDGAKSALADWNFTGSKAPKKKNKKKKQQQQPPTPQNGPQNGPKSPQSVSSESSVKTNGDIGDQASVMPLMNGILHIENDIAKVTTTTTVLTNLDLPCPSSPTLSEMSSVSSSHLMENGQSEVKVTDVLESEPHPKHLHNHNHRQRTHSGSHSHGHKHDHDRNRTISSSSTPDDPKALAKRTAHGLEKSVKDLHRQTVSLERLKLVFNDEVEKAYKRIRSVFEEVRNCLNAREAELVQEMSCVKNAAGDTFAMRQSQAAELKVKIDRADRLDDTQLADLRAEIKHFVSDRKIDEDLGRTTRFLYDDDHLKDEIKKFCEIVPVKCTYGSTTHRSVSMTSDPDSHIPPSPAVETSGAYALTVPSASSTHTSEKPNVPHLDHTETHEMAELQKRLKNSLTLGGIAVETYPDRPQSAPVNTDDQPPRPARPESAYNRNRGNRNRRRPQDRDRPRNNGNDGRDNRQIYNQQQGTGGERVILIGRGTRPQSSQSRPPRGGGGRGRGYGGRGRGRGDNPGGYSGPMPDEAGSQPSGENSASRTTQNSTSEESSKSAPPRAQRSPRRGGRGRGGGARSEASGGSVRQSQDNQSKSSSSQPSVSAGSETKGQ